MPRLDDRSASQSYDCEQALNTSSKNAAIRLGFKFEGVFRQMLVIKGRNRDSAWFSIIDTEWKKLKQGYLKYLSLKNFNNNFKQKRKLRF